jgi:hypothetical protein
MNFEDIINEIVSGFNLESDLEKRKAYMKCVEYAELNLHLDEYNMFIFEAAKKLGQMRIITDYIKSDIQLEGDEKINIDYDENSGFIISGNKEGLVYLSRVMRNLANSKMEGSHVHLYNDEPPIVGSSYSAVIYIESEEWFEKQITGVNQEELVKDIDTRNIDVNEIVGLIILEEVPPPLLMSKGKIYKVLSYRKYKDEDKVWKKIIRDEKHRMYVFSIKRDDGEINELALDLDDLNLLFITKDEIRNIVK